MRHWPATCRIRSSPYNDLTVLRILFIILGSLAAYYAQPQDDDVFQSIVLSYFNLIYLLFLLWNFTQFLVALSKYGSKGNDVNLGELAYDVIALLYAELHDKYVNTFQFMGRYSNIVIEIIIHIGIALVLFSCYNEVNFIIKVIS